VVMVVVGGCWYMVDRRCAVLRLLLRCGVEDPRGGGGIR
jgi:hypothetical protein